MRLPPYSADIVKARRLGRVPVPGPLGHIVILPSWHLKITGAFVVCPDDTDPATLDFFFVAGLDVTLLLRPIDYPRALDVALSVLSGNPRSLSLIDVRRAQVGGVGSGVLVVYSRRHRV